MIQIITFAVFIAAALTGFFICIFSYRLGLKDGQALSNNTKLKPIQTPFAKKKTEEQPTEEVNKNFHEGLQNIVNHFNRHNLKGDNEQ